MTYFAPVCGGGGDFAPVCGGGRILSFSGCSGNINDHDEHFYYSLRKSIYEFLPAFSNFFWEKVKVILFTFLS